MGGVAVTRHPLDITLQILWTVSFAVSAFFYLLYYGSPNGFKFMTVGVWWGLEQSID